MASGRFRLFAPTALVAALALSACGSSSGDAADAAPPQSKAFPVTVHHAYGETTVETEPQRVVSIGFNDLDFALALGVQPVATRAFSGYDFQTRPWARDVQHGTVPEVGGMELNYEQIAAQQPDLLLGTYSVLKRDGYAKAEAIAPTIGDVQTADGGQGTWQQQLEAVGQALGRSDRATALEHDVQARIDAVHTQYPAIAGKRLAVAMYYNDGFYVFEPTDPRAALFYQLGFTPTDYSGAVSLERLDVLDADALVVLGAKRDDLANNAAFQRLSVVSTDRTVYLGSFGSDLPAALGFASPLSIPYLLDRVGPARQFAADADEATRVPEL